MRRHVLLASASVFSLAGSGLACDAGDEPLPTGVDSSTDTAEENLPFEGSPALDPAPSQVPPDTDPWCNEGSCCPEGLDVVEGTAMGDWLTSQFDKDECIVGKAGADKILSTAEGRVVIFAGPGHDEVVCTAVAGEVYGQKGDDELTGSPGDDLIFGQSGADKLWGDLGDDELVGGGGGDLLYGQGGADWLIGGGGDDELRGGMGEDLLQGGPGDDELWGGVSDDDLRGGKGADALRGGSGADSLRGGAGDDELRGNGGDDVLRPGSGVDTSYGGGGNDVIVVRGSCEVGVGESIHGGTGHDIVRSPLSESELEQLEVVSKPLRGDRCGAGRRGRGADSQLYWTYCKNPQRRHRRPVPRLVA